MKTRLVGKPVPGKADNSSPHRLLPSFLLSRRWFANCSFASYCGVPEPFQVQEVNIWNFPLLSLDFGRGNVVLRSNVDIWTITKQEKIERTKVGGKKRENRVLTNMVEKR